MSVTLNADLGESLGIHSFGNDDALLEHVDLVNVACGMHSGDPSTMARTVERALAAGAAIGAHPGLPDLVGFGRRAMALTAGEVRDLLRYQVGALTGFLDAAGGRLHHLKPHGALYGMLARDEELMDAACDVAVQYGVPVLGLPHTAHQRVSARRGVAFVEEFYVDLDYADDGTVVVNRSHATPDVERLADRTATALRDHEVVTVSGRILPVTADSLCLHSDLPHAPQLAARIRQLVDEHNAAER
ncbi:5-oxoprolinase subunit PxpA [Kocuria oceani]|uniref:5-oxoprolinase subunit PxpA n=1 Tax=Kocuria oceani TaxID=988827 RepID=UPI004035C2A6